MFGTRVSLISGSTWTTTFGGPAGEISKFQFSGVKFLNLVSAYSGAGRSVGVYLAVASHQGIGTAAIRVV
jgi:hypothetical protein